MNDIVSDAYYLGTKNIGGGVVGTVIAALFTKLLGTVGTVIISMGFAIILLVKMFKMKPAERIASYVDDYRDRREEMQKDRELEAEEREIRRRKLRQEAVKSMDEEAPEKKERKKKKFQKQIQK